MKWDDSQMLIFCLEMLRLEAYFSLLSRPDRFSLMLVPSWLRGCV